MTTTAIAQAADKQTKGTRLETRAAFGISPQAELGTPAGLPLFLQRAALTVNPPDDPFEREAEQVAAMVTNRRSSPPMLRPAPGAGARLQRCACGGVADADGECAACRAKRLAIQRKAEAGSGGGMKAPSSVLPTGGGQPLPLALLAQFEPRFGHDFGNVRLHTDSEAAGRARAVQARAFTIGREIVFGAGQYAPETMAGQRLLAHELTHVVQQNGAQTKIQRRVDGDIRAMSITRSWAEALTDAEMGEQVRIVRDQIAHSPSGSAENQSARDNLAVLEQVQNARNLRQLTVTSGVVTEQTVPRPPGLPADGGFTLIPAPSHLSLSGDVLNQIPEGQLVDAPPALMAAAMTPQIDLSLGTDLPLGDVGMGTSVAAMTALRASGQYLQTYGFAAAGENAIGFVAIPRLFTPGQYIPQSTSTWGHTAMYVRQGGRITIVRGFMPGSIVDTIRHARQIEAGMRSTPAAIANDTRLFLNTGARSLEYAVDPALAAQAARGLPEVGPIRPSSGLPTHYTARPSVQNICTQSNCGLWAVEQMEQHLGGAVGPRPGTSVTALGEGATVPRTASQGRLINFTQGDTFAPVPHGANPTPGGMSTGFRVLRWGGRIFFVVGVALTVAEIAMARPEDRERTAVGATAGFVGGLVLGAAAGLACGPGAPVCSVVLGLTYGILGGIWSRSAAESIYDATHPPRTGRPATEQELREFNAAWQRAGGGRCPSGNCHLAADQRQPPGAQWNAPMFPSSPTLVQPTTHAIPTSGIGVQRQLSEEDTRIILQWIQSEQSARGSQAAQP